MELVEGVWTEMISSSRLPGACKVDYSAARRDSRSLAMNGELLWKRWKLQMDMGKKQLREFWGNAKLP